MTKNKIEYLSEMISDVHNGTNFLGAVKPNTSVEEYWIKQFSPSGNYVVLYSTTRNVDFWISTTDVAVFELL